MKKITNLFGILFIALTVVALPAFAQEAMEGDVATEEMMEVDQEVGEAEEAMEVFDDPAPFDFDEFEGFDDIDEFGEVETQPVSPDPAVEEGNTTVMIVVLVVVALGLIIFLVTRKR